MFADIPFIFRFGKKKRKDRNTFNCNSISAGVVKISISF